MPNHTELLELLLTNRNIMKADWDAFLNPSYTKGLYDPYLMKDMEKAVVRIFEAIESKEKIVIYSDYDCDGIPASVIIHDFLTKIDYQNFTIYIPDRHDEGYGLHLDAIDGFIKDGVNLLITFDLGITAVEETRRATAAGIDVIITDHHLPQEEIPKAYAILNPKCEGCTYPDKMLCGAGIAFKLVQALVIKYGEYWKISVGWEKWLLDMAGVATLSDQVPLVNENRVLAYYGLKVLQKGRRPGLVELFKKAGVDISKLTEEDVTFTLAPRINAASRMADPIEAFNLLKATDLIEAKELAKRLSDINDERKHIVAQIMKEVKHTLSLREEKLIIVIGNPKWRIGVLGIVASKIVDEHKKSVFVWGADGNGEIKGSCRSYGKANLVELMTSLPSNSFLAFGGHKAAGGFSVSHDEIHFLEERLIKVLKDSVESNEENAPFLIDSIISLDDVNYENFKVIDSLAPYGAGNPKPMFKIVGEPIVALKEFGKEKNHLELTFRNSRGIPIKAIVFFKTRDSFKTGLSVGDKIDATVTFEKSTFGGRTELRLRIIDII